MARDTYVDDNNNVVKREEKYSFDAKVAEPYKKAAYRLWEKLEFYNEDINIDSLNDYAGDWYHWEDIAAVNDFIDYLVEDVEEEFNIVMLDIQKEWALHMCLSYSMKKFNEENSLNLEPRD